PAYVAEKAAASGCDFFALTDHDSIDGVAEADEAAAKAGIRNIHGIELSAYCGREIHILGYGIDIENEGFLRLLSEQQARRKARAEKILVRLAAYRMPIDFDYFEGKVHNVFSRMHIARAIADYGYEPDFYTALCKWLKEDAPTFVPNEGLTPEEIIAAIHAAGGYAVLAHPVRLNMDGAERAAFISRLTAAGLDGLEAVYKRTSHKAVRELKKVAQRCGLFVTAGADYHGDGNEIIPRKTVAPFIVKQKK
ncbi:MAG: PHP domain-containing protein, partial [Clostridiales bacterium]|nr:PHP domain-containing protein [Clostridiales bacterium]